MHTEDWPPITRPLPPPPPPPAKREHHDEARDRLIVDALKLARRAMTGADWTNAPKHGEPAKERTKACQTCDAIERIDVALKVLGK